jgi:hypothetical protein
MEPTKRSSSQITRSTREGADKKVRPSLSITWELATDRNWKDTQSFVMHLSEDEGTIVDGVLAVPASLIIDQVHTHLSSLDLDDPKSNPRSIVALMKGDKLPLRYYLTTTASHNLVTAAKFTLWAIPLDLHMDETVPNWFPTTMDNIPTTKGQSHFAPTLTLLQPDKKDQFKRITTQYQPDEFGRFLAVRDEELRGLINAGLVGCIWDHSPNLWQPPVRIAGAFGRTVTNSHDYTSRHPQGRVRVLLHQDMLVPEDVVRGGEKLTVGDRYSIHDNDGSDSGEDPTDLVVSAKLRTYFKGHKQWIIDGTRKNVDAFLTKHMGCYDNGLYRMVNSGYAQYMIPKIPTSFRL